VADNASTDRTREVLAGRYKSFALRPLYLQERGKAAALNLAMDCSRGQLLVFTDDDVTPGPNWLSSLYEASKKYSNGTLFCGPIEPLFPAEVDKLFEEHPYCHPAFARFEPRQPEGLLQSGLLPFGPNFAVKKSYLGDLKFRTDLGPSAKNGALMSDDVDFVAELKDRYSPFVPGAGFYYLPDAKVHHRVRVDQLSVEWITRRFFLLGRSRAVRYGRITPLSSPTLLLREPSNTREDSLARNAELHFYLGLIYEFRKLEDISRSRHIERMLHQHGLLSGKDIRLTAEASDVAQSITQ
jgi:glycosyltransferase involved in cell wall biosynthesis